VRFQSGVETDITSFWCQHNQARSLQGGSAFLNIYFYSHNNNCLLGAVVKSHSSIFWQSFSFSRGVDNKFLQYSPMESACEVLLEDNIVRKIIETRDSSSSISFPLKNNIISTNNHGSSSRLSPHLGNNPPLRTLHPRFSPNTSKFHNQHSQNLQLSMQIFSPQSILRSSRLRTRPQWRVGRVEFGMDQCGGM
jgi:hypothetical protein